MTVRTMTLLLACLMAAACKSGSLRSLQGKSLTTIDDDARNASRTKFFFGFREILDDPEMNNETYADNRHIKDMALDANGGGYKANPAFKEGFLETYNGQGSQQIAAEYNRIINSVKPGDMFLQMSSGHGYEGGARAGGLAVGATHEEIKTYALKMLDKGAQEVVIFMMACNSGGIVDAFSAADLSRYEGKTIFVMASSAADVNSSTGDMSVDPTIGGQGSTGSAFGNSLWKALQGAADINKDGVITLQEIIDYVVPATENLGGHKPQYLGGHFKGELPIKCLADNPKAATNPYCRVGNPAPAAATPAPSSTPSSVFDPKAATGTTSGGSTTGRTSGGAVNTTTGNAAPGTSSGSAAPGASSGTGTSGRAATGTTAGGGSRSGATAGGSGNTPTAGGQAPGGSASGGQSSGRPNGGSSGASGGGNQDDGNGGGPASDGGGGGFDEDSDMNGSNGGFEG